MLATSFEDALMLYRRFHEHVLTVISDVRFPRRGAEDPEAGFELLRHVRADSPDLPVLLQSADPANAARAAELGVTVSELVAELARVAAFPFNPNGGFPVRGNDQAG